MPETTDSLPATSLPAGADVCLYVEGAYPYVRGGVSTWVHQIITELPELTFHVVHIGAEEGGTRQYAFPPNLRDYRELFLFTSPIARKREPLHEEAMRLAHERLEALTASPPPDLMAEAIDVFAQLAPACPFEAFWRHPKTWGLLQTWYERHHPREVFVDYFWNVRFLLEPAWRVLEAIPTLPPARVHHSIATGYAGLAAAVAARHQDKAFLLSEHGIYVRERIADLLRSSWAPENLHLLAEAASRDVPALRRIWIDYFAGLGRHAYRRAGGITSLFRRNAEMAAEFGAPKERIQIIPNGVKLDIFPAIRADRQARRATEPQRRCVGFLGRVSPIKDVKNLLRAARVVLDLVPGVTFLIVGPVDEDADYCRECEDLARALHLEQAVEFSGPLSLAEALPRFDVMVLPSLSEGLPFALLESLAAEVPCVTTDVGACREIIEGQPGEQPSLGPAGLVVPPADAGALGQALAALVGDRARQDRLGEAGRRRVEAHYTEASVLAGYRRLYGTLKP